MPCQICKISAWVSLKVRWMESEQMTVFSVLSLRVVSKFDRFTRPATRRRRRRPGGWKQRHPQLYFPSGHRWYITDVNLILFRLKRPYNHCVSVQLKTNLDLQYPSFRAEIHHRDLHPLTVVVFSHSLHSHLLWDASAYLPSGGNNMQASPELLTGLNPPSLYRSEKTCLPSGFRHMPTCWLPGSHGRRPRISSLLSQQYCLDINPPPVRQESLSLTTYRSYAWTWV